MVCIKTIILTTDMMVVEIILPDFHFLVHVMLQYQLSTYTHIYIHRGDDDCLKFILVWFFLLPVNEATNTHYEEEQNHSVDVYWIRINYKLGLEEIASSSFLTCQLLW